MTAVFLNETLGVIVLYNTKIEDSKTIQSINRALDSVNHRLDVVVYDNSFLRLTSKSDFIYRNLNIHYLHDSSNGGVSKAYNYGGKYAKNLADKKWIWLLDQDTRFAENIFHKFNEAIWRYPNIKLFVPILMTHDNIIFSPCRYYFGRGFALKKISPGIITFKKTSPVNSGMIVDLSLFFMAGTYNELIKLDFSDFNFIERVKKIEPAYCIINSIGIQDFSNNETDIYKLNNRYVYFCEGAKICGSVSISNKFKYLLVALMRASTLAYRSRSLIFYKTFIKYYIKS